MTQEGKYAIQQFTGYRFFEQYGNRITGLADEMGLTAKEWTTIHVNIQWLGAANIAELDEYFKTDKAADR